MDAVMRGLDTDGGHRLVALFGLPAKLLVIALVVTSMSGCDDLGDDGGGDYTPPVYDPDDYSDPNDQDYDGVTADSDNCPDNYNDDQTDGDGDGLGDICDNCPGQENADQFDNDADGTGDACDACMNDPLKTEEGVCGCNMPDVDLDGDGQPDCEGTPTFTEQIIDDTISEGAQIELADLDGDNDLDVVAAIANTDAIYAYLNQGGGASWIKLTVAQPLTLVAKSIALADIDGDGDLDVAAVDHYDRLRGPDTPGQIVWYRHPAGTQGEWEPNQVTDHSLWGARFINAADLTGNGHPDLVVGSIGVDDTDGRRQGDGVVWIRNEDGGQTWSEPITIDDVLEGVTTVLTYDVNEDGVTDVLASGFEDNDVMWYANSRSAGQTDLNPTFASYSMGLIPNPYDIAIAEAPFGYAEAGPVVVVTDTGFQSDLDVSYLVPLTARTESWVSWTVSTDFPDGTLSRVCPLDFNGDGRTDVAVTSDPWSDLRVYLGDDDGRWDWLSVAGGAYTGLTDVKCGDIDGDNRPDLVTITTQHFRGDRVAWWPNAP